jgi:hypothetical protein
LGRRTQPVDRDVSARRVVLEETRNRPGKNFSKAQRLTFGLVRDVEQHVGVARPVERAPAREVQAPEFGAHMRARELRTQRFVGEVTSVHRLAESRYRRGNVGDAGRTDDERIAPPRAAVHLPGTGRHAPTLLPAELDALLHATTVTTQKWRIRLGG